MATPLRNIRKPPHATGVADLMSGGMGVRTRRFFNTVASPTLLMSCAYHIAILVFVLFGVCVTKRRYLCMDDMAVHAHAWACVRS